MRIYLDEEMENTQENKESIAAILLQPWKCVFLKCNNFVEFSS